MISVFESRHQNGIYSITWNLANFGRISQKVALYRISQYGHMSVNNKSQKDCYLNINIYRAIKI